MSLLSAFEEVLANLAQELHNVDEQASVLVQFAAGDWQKLKSAFEAEKQVIANVVNEVKSPKVTAPKITAPSTETTN